MSKTTKKTKATKKATKKAGPKKATRSPAAEATAAVADGAPATAPAKKRKAKKAAEPKARRTSALDAAAQVLKSAKEPMNAKDLIEAMAKQGLWSSPAGRTPHATLYAALHREIAAKGKAGRFAKADRGLFAYNGGKE